MKCNDCAFYRVCDAGKKPMNIDVLDSNVECICPQFLKDEDFYIARELVDLMVKKRSGQVVELPVPIGGKVYEIDSDGEIYEHTLRAVIYDTPHIAFDDRAIGTRFFATREAAAEHSLAKRQTKG